MPKLKRPLMLAGLSLLAMMSLTACVHRTHSPVIDKRIVCVAFEPIRYSRLQDTEPTIAAVKSHNAAWSAVCTNPPQ